MSLGEVMIRFDPGNDRIHNARSFRVFEGGGEYNVARNLSKVFRQKTAVLTALARNQIGELVEDLIWQGGVDSSEIIWRETDGICRRTRNGMYFIERGFGPRAPVGCSDRGNTAVSQLKAGDFDWPEIFGTRGARWFHTGGIFAGLSETTSEVALEAMRAARQSGAIVSYDLNYRASLWQDRGGLEAANALNQELLKEADVVFGVENFNADLAEFSEEKFESAARDVLGRFPRLQIAATTLRHVESAAVHSLSGAALADGQVFKAIDLENIAVLDRVGSGDAFAAGFIYGLLTGKEIKASLDHGVANAALTLTTLGDCSSATLDEVEKLSGAGKISLFR